MKIMSMPPCLFRTHIDYVWDKSLLIKMNVQAVHSNCLEGNTSVVVTDLWISFPLV